MNEETSFVLFEDVVVPESALLKVERNQPHGSVPGLVAEELANPDELAASTIVDCKTGGRARWN